MSFNPTCENKIFTKISEFTVNILGHRSECSKKSSLITDDLFAFNIVDSDPVYPDWSLTYR